MAAWLIAAHTAAAATNEAPRALPQKEPPPPAPLPFKLSPEAEKLRASPYFSTSVSELDGLMLNLCVLQPMGDRNQEGEVRLTLARRLDKNGAAFSVGVHTHAPTKARASVDGGKPLVFSLDGHRYICQPNPLQKEAAPNGQGWSQVTSYDVGEVLIRAIAKGSRREVRVPVLLGERDFVLDDVSAARAKVFVRAFLDDGSGSAPAMAR